MVGPHPDFTRTQNPASRGDKDRALAVGGARPDEVVCDTVDGASAHVNPAYMYHGSVVGMDGMHWVNVTRVDRELDAVYGVPV